MTPSFDDARLRTKMVKTQLSKRGICDKRVLEVMGVIPRHLFVPEAFRKHAYEDKPLGIGQGQTISQPFMVALMTQLLKLKAEDVVLEVGTGSGYQAAILASLCRKVISIERHKALADSTHACLKAQGFDTIDVRVGDGSLGVADEALFDAIVVTAGGPEISETLKHQLKVGARMVCPVGDREAQDLMVVTREKNCFVTQRHSRCRFVPLLGEEGWNE